MPLKAWADRPLCMDKLWERHRETLEWLDLTEALDKEERRRWLTWLVKKFFDAHGIEVSVDELVAKLMEA